MEKYLNLEGLTKFKEELEKLRLADKLELTGALNDLSGDIGNGTFTVKRNNVTVGSFSANQKTNDEINIVVPTSISDLGQTAITEIQNLINYGQLDVSDLTEEQKEALHESTLDDSDFVDETSLSTELANYGKIINYDSSTKMIQLKNGNTVLSQFSAQDFLVDGMLEDVRITNGTGDNAGKSVLLIDFNTESGITDIEIPLEQIFNANNYYTKTEIDNAGFLTQHQDISGKADKSEMSITSANGTATIQLKSGTSVSVLTQHQDISGKANSVDLATVATSGSYNDLSDKPVIPSNSVMGASGVNHSSGLVPDPGATQGNTKFLREDGTWQTPPEGITYESKNASSGGTEVSLVTTGEKYTWNNKQDTISDLSTIRSGASAGATAYQKPSTGIPASDIASGVIPTKASLGLDNVDNTADANKSVNYANSAGSAPANGGNSSTVNGHTVNSDVPEGAVFTDTNTWRPLGTGADDACAGNDSRLSDSRPASDVYSWAKAASKPSYSYSEISNTPSSLPANGGNADTLDNIDSSGFFRNFGVNGFFDCSSMNAQGITTIDGYSQGPDNSANVTVLNLGEYSSARFKQLLFNYENDNIYYRRKAGDTPWTSWISLITSSNIGSQTVNYATTAGSAPASDVYSWAKAASKPSYGYSEIGYTVNTVTSAGGTLSLDGTVPLHVVTLTGNVSALTLSANPPAGHSCHIILTASSEYTVAIAHDSTNRVCPTAEDVSLTVKANGYVEIDFLSAGGKVYVRGV